MVTNFQTTTEAKPSASSEFGFLTRHTDAAQPIAKRSEPNLNHPAEAAGATKINRRSIMNMVMSAAALTATSIVNDTATAQATPVAAGPSEAAILWAQRQNYVIENNALGVAYLAALDQLPAWAKSGPRLLAHDGTYCGRDVGWPLDVDVTPPEHQSVYRVCRLSTYDVKERFDFEMSVFPNPPAVRAIHRANMRATLRKVIARIRAQKAERARVGLDENERRSLELSKAQWRVEEAIQTGRQTPDVKAVDIMLSLQENCLLNSSAEDDSEMALACIPLEMLLPQLTGLIREHAAFYLENRTARLRDMPFATT